MSKSKPTKSATSPATPKAGKKSTIEAKPKRRRSFSSLAQAERWLDDRVNVERVRPHRVDKDAFRLDRMRALMSALDNPQDSMPLVHVAGSKGKGSVCEMLSGCLGANGYTVGVYCSPHLVTIRERIRVGTQMIGEAAFARLLTRVREAAESIENSQGLVTYFECVTACAFLYFA